MSRTLVIALFVAGCGSEAGLNNDNKGGVGTTTTTDGGGGNPSTTDPDWTPGEDTPPTFGTGDTGWQWTGTGTGTGTNPPGTGTGNPPGTGINPPGTGTGNPPGTGTWPPTGTWTGTPTNPGTGTGTPTPPDTGIVPPWLDTGLTEEEFCQAAYDSGLATYLDPLQTAGDGRVYYCHSSSGSNWVFIESDISSCLPHLNHNYDVFPSTGCDS